MSVDFKVVKKRRKSKQNKNFAFQQYSNENFICCKLEKIKEELQESQFCFELLKSIDDCLILTKNNSIKEILCYGLGNFSDSKSSLHQLAALIVVQHKYNSKVKLFDPVFNSIEVKVLELLNCEVLPDNEEGKRKIIDDKVTLVFLPHCPKQLTNNFLWANWNISLRNCLIISNSFKNIIQNNSQKQLEKSAKYILKLQPKTKEISLDNNYHIENIFNDISIHYFDLLESDASFFVDTIEDEPVYSDEIELIRNKVKEVCIQNE